MFEPKTVETAVVPRPFLATYIATKQFGNDVPDAASNSESEDRRTGYVRVDVVQLDDAVERHRKVLIGDVLRAHERPEQGDRVEDDAGDAEVDVLVRPRREAAVGAGAHDALACPLDARVDDAAALGKT